MCALAGKLYVPTAIDMPQDSYPKQDVSQHMDCGMQYDTYRITTMLAVRHVLFELLHATTKLQSMPHYVQLHTPLIIQVGSSGRRQQYMMDEERPTSTRRRASPRSIQHCRMFYCCRSMPRYAIVASFPRFDLPLAAQGNSCCGRHQKVSSS